MKEHIKNLWFKYCSERIHKVIESCTTKKQLNVARKYSDMLTLKKIKCQKERLLLILLYIQLYNKKLEEWENDKE